LTEKVIIKVKRVVISGVNLENLLDEDENVCIKGMNCKDLCLLLKSPSVLEVAGLLITVKTRPGREQRHIIKFDV
jgi:hypothetical protein